MTTAATPSPQKSLFKENSLTNPWTGSHDIMRNKIFLIITILLAVAALVALFIMPIKPQIVTVKIDLPAGVN